MCRAATPTPRRQAKYFEGFLILDKVVWDLGFEIEVNFQAVCSPFSKFYIMNYPWRKWLDIGI